jgi:hypothetical protein
MPPGGSTAGSPPDQSPPGSSHGTARLRGHAASPVLVHADAAVDLARLPAPLPVHLPGPPRSAEGPAVGAQQPRRERAQRAGGLVAAAAGAAERFGCRGVARPRVDRGGLRRFLAVRQVPRAGEDDGRGLRGGTGSRRRAGRRGTHGGHSHRGDRRLRAHRPPGRARRRAGRRRLQDRAPRAHRRRRPQLAGARAVRAGGGPLAAPRLQPGGTAPPADGAGACLGSHAGEPRQASAASRDDRRRMRGGRRGRA